MRPLKLIIKDYRITIRWLKDEVKKDIKNMFNSALSPNTYGNIARDFFRAFKHIFTSSTYGVYWAIFLFIFSVIYANLFWQILFGILIPVAYIHAKLASGEPIRDYKKKYY